MSPENSIKIPITASVYRTAGANVGMKRIRFSISASSGVISARSLNQSIGM